MSLMRIPKPIRLIGLSLLSLILVACPQQQPPPPSPSADFTLALNPTSLTVEQGQAGNTTLTLTPRNGFTGQVNLSLVGAPQGVTLEPGSVNVTGANPVTQTLTVRVAGSTPAGTYSLKVRAQGGSITKEADLSLTVRAATPTENVTLLLRDPEGRHVATYYRVGSGSWQELTFQNNQATFPAQGAVEYEVATRCQGGGNIADLQFFKASTSQTRQVNVTCSHGQGQGGQRTNVTFNVQLPSQIGGVSVQDGDVVVVHGADGTVSSLTATVTAWLPEGQQQVLVALFRVGSQGLQPIGGKLVSANITSGATVSVNNQGWVAMSPRTISATLPSGFVGYGIVYFFKDGMKDAPPVGVYNPTQPGFDRYGVLSGVGGVYLGYFMAQDSGSNHQLIVLKDTGGNDWTVSLPQPWAPNQFNPSGTSFTFSYPNAQAFTLNLYGLAEEQGTGNPLRVSVLVYAGGNTTSYTLPSLETQLGYTYRTGTSVSYNLGAVLRGVDSPIFDALFGSSELPLSEALLRNTDLAFASMSGNYTVP